MAKQLSALKKSLVNFVLDFFHAFFRILRIEFRKFTKKIFCVLQTSLLSINSAINPANPFDRLGGYNVCCIQS